VAPTPAAAPVTQLSSLRSILSLHPRTLLHPSTITNWTNDWDNEDNKAGGTEESKDDVLIVKKTAEPTIAAVPALGNDLAANPTNTTHDVDTSTSVGSDSPILLTTPDSPGHVAVDGPHPLMIHDSGACFNYMGSSSPLLPTGKLPVSAINGMATLQRAILEHLAELDCQRISIEEKYDALYDLLIRAQTGFDAPAIERRVKTAVGPVYAELIVTLSDWALTAVDEAITAAVAPDGMLAHRICDEVTAAVTTAVDKLVTETVTSRIHDTLDDVFMSYRDCVLHERKLAEEGLTDFITA
jgi:hypothetical protein